MQYRYNSQKGKGKEVAAPQTGGSAIRNAEEGGTRPYPPGPPSVAVQPVQRQLDQEQQRNIYAQNFGTGTYGGFGEPPWFSAPLVFRPSRRQRVQSLVPLNEAARHVLDFENAEDPEDERLRALCAHFVQFKPLTADEDAFRVLPQFASPELDSAWLVQTCELLDLLCRAQDSCS